MNVVATEGRDSEQGTFGITYRYENMPVYA